MTTEQHHLEITPNEWSTADTGKLRMRGPSARTVAGKYSLVTINLAALPAEERYALGRTLARWAAQVERVALADIEAEAQMPLFP